MKPPTDKTKQILTCAAIFEGRFSFDWVIELTSCKASEVLKALNAGEEEDILVKNDLNSFQFSSVKKREQYLRPLPEIEINSLHQRIR